MVIPTLCFLKICILLKNDDFVENTLEKKLIFYCDFDIFDGSIGCATKFNAEDIFFFYLFLIKSYSVFCQKVAKVEHTICDCNWLSQDIQIN